MLSRQARDGVTNENNGCIETRRDTYDENLSEMGQYVEYKGREDETKCNVKIYG